MNLRDRLVALCDVIDAKESELRALVPGTFSRDAVWAQVSKLEAASPTSEKPLWGLVAGIKDIFRVDGYPTLCGSKLPPELFAGAEAASVSRLRKAGVVVVGKTVTAEFAGPEPGETRNPHNLRHTPGGSSSGSAAGVAAGYFEVALGTQTLGSITRPAAYCGVIGVKPSFGRIPIAGVVLFSGSADHVGVFFSEASLMHPVLSVLIDDWRVPPSIPGRKARLAIPRGPYLAQASRNALSQFEATVERLRNAGHDVQRLAILEDIHAINNAHQRLVTGEVARLHADWFGEYSHLYRPRTADYIRRGQIIPDGELQELRDFRLKLRESLTHRMRDGGIDGWICPSATDRAPAGLVSTGDPVMNLPWTNSGLPTVSIPTGLDSAGLPHGLQLVGDFGQDEALVTLASELCSSLN